MAGLRALKHILIGGVLASALLGCDAQTAEQSAEPCEYDKNSYAYELATLILDPDDPDARVQFREELAAATRRGESAVGISRDYVFLYDSPFNFTIVDRFVRLALNGNHIPIVHFPIRNHSIIEAFDGADDQYAKSFEQSTAPRISYVFASSISDPISFADPDAISNLIARVAARTEFQVSSKGGEIAPFRWCRILKGRDQNDKPTMFVFSGPPTALNCLIYSYLMAMGLNGPGLERNPASLTNREPFLRVPYLIVEGLEFIYGESASSNSGRRVQAGMNFCALYRAAEFWKPRNRI